MSAETTDNNSKLIELDEGMTDYQFKTFLKLILEMIRGSEDKEEAMKKIEELIGDVK